MPLAPAPAPPQGPHEGADPQLWVLSRLGHAIIHTSSADDPALQEDQAQYFPSQSELVTGSTVESAGAAAPTGPPQPITMSKVGAGTGGTPCGMVQMLGPIPPPQTLPCSHPPSTHTHTCRSSRTSGGQGSAT